jgi:hypothetical protein
MAAPPATSLEFRRDRRADCRYERLGFVASHEGLKLKLLH